MKKIFTLFALLSVGLSAWAQTYTLELIKYPHDENVEDGSSVYSGIIKPNETINKVFYLNESFNYNLQVLDDENNILVSEKVSGFTADFFNALTITYNPDAADGPKLTYLDNYDIVDWSDCDLIQINLSDDVSFAIPEGEVSPSYVHNYLIEYTRTCSNQWGTLCLPFSFGPSEPSNVTFYQLSSVTADAMKFSPIIDNTEVDAGTPLVFKLDEGCNELDIKSNENPQIIKEVSPCSKDGWTMYGTVDETTIDNGWVLQENEIRQIDGSDFPIKPYRAWFEGTRQSDAPFRIAVDETEGLQFVEQEDGTVKVSYDLQGRKLNEARKGLMIENGKVIMVK